MNTTFRKNHSYEMVLHRPVEPALLLSKFALGVSGSTRRARSQVAAV
jgi:hypothetical protein